MTRERREDAVIVALVVSIAIHVGLMLAVRPQVMTRIVPTGLKARARVAMSVRRTTPRPEPVKIAALADLDARRDAPAAVDGIGVPLATGIGGTISGDRVVVPVPMPDPELRSPTQDRPVFSARPPDSSAARTSVAPLARIETPSANAASSPTPEFSMKMPVASGPEVPAAAMPSVVPDEVRAPEITQNRVAGPVFTPAREVYAKVDEQVVADEKLAVRDLVEAASAEDLTKCVDMSVSATASGAWRYFRVRIAPRGTLPVVAKDVVMVIDGSGSIGNDRLSSCRKAARRILRTCTNSGDRFNLVVFRNAFSYAFREWRDCDAASFEAGDRWLMRQAAHGRTDVFSTIRSVLTLPRDPTRPLIALVVTDGDANYGVSDTAEILSRFTALNDGLVSVYMYGVKSSANRELIDVLTHGNRGESFVFEGWRWSAGEGMEELSERFRDPVLSDIRIIFASGAEVESYPHLLRNLYLGGRLEFVGRIPASAREIAFSLRGLNGATAYEGFFKIPFSSAADDPSLVAAWETERAIGAKLGN